MWAVPLQSEVTVSVDPTTDDIHCAKQSDLCTQYLISIQKLRHISNFSNASNLIDATSAKISISSIYHCIMRKLNKNNDPPSTSLLLLTDFPSLVIHGVLTSKTRNEVKKFAILLEANSQESSTSLSELNLNYRWFSIIDCPLENLY
eukprot:TRINITY_DN5507_c0_g4_i1.p1 TRINITY_DN5507_c0_g4~~TRINITY_DN5507_c0_g4_i1.p1  ORF type:complete len:147 (+),score=11.02 TRINITY_DN5507_c0_g4_i1:288-728(+)